MIDRNLDAEIDIDVSEAGRPPDAPHPLSAEEAQDALATFEREARALGNDAAAAPLFHEMGLLWEEHLKNPRNAAMCFQNAYRLAPRYLPNLRAARRLFADVGNWQMVAQLLDAEAAAVSDESHRVSLMLQKATVLEDRLGKADDAVALLEQCRQRAPNDFAVLSALETVFTARADNARLAELYPALAQSTDDDALKVHYLVSAARLAESAGQPAQAADLFRRAFALRGQDATLLSAVKRAAEREKNDEELLSALAAEAQAAGPGGAPIFFRMCRIYDRLGKPQQALEALQAGRKASPEDAVTLDELARVYETSAQWKELAEVLQARLAKLTDPSEIIAVNLRLGTLADEHLADPEGAIRHFRAVLSSSPSQTAAVGALGRLYARAQNWTGLLEIYDAEIAGTDDARQKAARHYRAGELLETRLSREPDAVARYAECLKVLPGYLPAQKALARLYERAERWDDLIALWESDIAGTKDRDQVVSVLSRIAALQEERKKDLPGAAATLRRILDLVPDHLPTVRNLQRLCERGGLWPELIAACELEASLANDSKQVLSLYHSIAEIWDEQLKQKDRAIETYRKVLSLSANYLPALQALGRLYAQERKFEELMQMYRQEAEITPSPEQAAGLVFKAGELLEQKLNRLDDAILAYQEVLALSPTHFPALRALSRIYRAQRAWEALVEVLRSEAAARTDRAERANTLFQVGSLWEDELSRPDFAIESYQEVLALSPDHPPAFRALERLWGAQGAVPELVALFERELQVAGSPQEKIAAHEKLAAAYAGPLKDPARAMEHFEAILSADPRHLGALKAMEGLRSGDPARRADLRARLAAVASDPKASVALFMGAAMDRERSGSKGPVVEELLRAASLAPDDPRVAGELERAMRRAGEWGQLCQWLEAQLAKEPPGEGRLALLLRLGSLNEHHLGRDDRALAAYRAVVEAEATNLPALRGARRLFKKAGQGPEVHRLLLSEAAATRDPKAACDLLLQAGELAEALKDDAAARGAYQAVLARDPLEPRASERLENLLAKTGGAAERAALHQSRAATRAAGGDAAGAAQEHLAAAKVLAVSDTAGALSALDQALLLAPTHLEALALKGELALKEGRHAEAAHALAAQVELGGEPAALAALHRKLGILFQDHLGDPSRAAAHLQTVLATEPSDLESLQRLGALHLAGRNWGGAADVYRRLVESTTDPKALANHLVTLARIAEEGFNDHAAAIASYRRALDLVPSDMTVVDRLAALYERTGNVGEMGMLLEKQAQAAAERGDKPRAEAVRLKAADIYLKQGEINKAVQSLRFAIELFPEHVPQRVQLADILAKDSGSLVPAMEEHRNVLKLDPFRLESYHVLFRLWANSRQLDRAICAGHVLSFLKGFTEAEAATFTEAKGRVPQETTEVLASHEIDSTLQHPAARSPLSDVMRIIGDQLHKIHEPGLEALGLGRSDRLKPDSPVWKLAKSLCTAFGVEKFEVYQGKRGAQVTLENTDPLSFIVGSEIVRRYSAREQRFLFARAAYAMHYKLALAQKMDTAALSDLLGNAVRVVMPDFNRLGRADPELTRRIRKAMSGKAIKALEPVAVEVAGAKALDVGAWLAGTTWSADRAGVLLCGDLSAALQVMFREDPSVSGSRLDSTEQIVAAARKRRDMLEAVGYVLSDDHFKLRARLRLGLSA